MKHKQLALFINEEYEKATKYYEKMDFDNAIIIFSNLIKLISINQKYWFGLAACFHAKKDFKTALTLWHSTTILDNNDPYPYFYIAECLYYLKHDNKKIKKALMETKKRINNKELITQTNDLMKKIGVITPRKKFNKIKC